MRLLDTAVPNQRSLARNIDVPQEVTAGHLIDAELQRVDLGGQGIDTF